MSGRGSRFFVGRMLEVGDGSRRLLATLAVLVLLGAVSAGAALAESSSSSEEGVTIWPTSKEALADATAGAEPVAMPEGFDGSVSGPLTDLIRAEAAEVLDEAFGPAVEGVAEVYDKLEIKEFRSDHVAVVTPENGLEGGPHGLLSSVLPLRVEGDSGQKELVDLGLETVDGHLEPENPLVDVEIPAELSEGISFPQSDITISIATGDTDRAASGSGDATAFFPNIRTDSDIAITATPTGVETYTQLRSADAPRSEVFDLEIPQGAQLRADGRGGAEVVDAAGAVLLSISMPWAVDAEGEQVPAELEVAGSSITVTVDPPAEATYPILVDPLFESYNWSTNGIAGQSDWSPASNPGFRAAWSQGTGPGMNASSLEGPTTSGNQAAFNYHVPRFWSDVQAGLEPPTTFIRNMKLWNLRYTMGQDAYPYETYPFMQLGLWSDSKQQWVSYGYRDGTHGPATDTSWVYDLANPNEVSDVKHGGISLATWSSWNGPSRWLNVQQASVEVSDKDAPAFGELGGVPQWVDMKQGAAIPYKITDPGLGIHRLMVSFPAAPGGTWQTVTQNGCTGVAGWPCPRTASAATMPLTYNPSSMDQGEHFVKVYGYDPVDHVSAVGNARIKVDHTAPDLAWSGTLTEQGTVGTSQPSYTLNYNATDGDEVAPAPLTPLGSAGTGSGQLESPVGVAVDANGNVWASDLANRKLVQYSKSGAVIRQVSALSPTFDPRGVAVAPDGNIWVADRGGHQIVKVSPTGTYLGSVTTPLMSEPWGVAFGPGGEMWVSDLGAQRLFKFEKGELKLALPVAYPVGLTTDRFGNVWVAQQGLERVMEFNSSGVFLSAFGGPGTGNGQFNSPTGIAIAKSGHILVADAGNGRIQVFNTGGEFLRSFASTGSAANQLITPRGIAVGGNNSLYIVDTGNKRIATWSHADKDPQSGVAKLEIKVDGVAKETRTPGCATKNCVISGSWTMNADSYSVGKHKVEIIATDAVGRVSSKTFEVETHGDLSNPTVALSGSMTEQSTLGTTRPSYKLKVSASDPGLAEERKSGVASTTIKVDGALVDSASPGCPAGGCSISREWTLNSDGYTPGAHTAEVKATDASGRSTVKTLAFNIARDTTAPTFSNFDPFYTAPEGWLEQKTYRIQSLVSDTNGYGVTSVQLKVDGVVVLSSSQTCPVGGCSKTFGSEPPIDMNSYSGGAHPAELIASDGAGNWRKKTWTINVVPSGNISHTEAVATMEASDETSGATTVGGATGEGAVEELPMTGDVVFQGESTGFTAPEAAAPILVGRDPAEGMSVHIPVDDVTEEPCPFKEQELIVEQPSEPVPPEEHIGPCAGASTYGDNLIDRQPVEITPIITSGSATDLEVSAGANVVISANTQGNVDHFVRPLYSGAQTFTAIRDATAPVAYSWQVSLEEDQTLSLSDSNHAFVRWDSGHVAFTITASSAHDAIGTELPTTLSVAGDVLTLNVPHRSPSPAGGSYIYPVTAGTGWQGGFQTYEVAMPPPELPEEEDSEEVLEDVEVWDNEDEGRIRLMSSSAPQPLALTDDGKQKYHYKFRWSECRYGKFLKVPVTKRREQLALYIGACGERDSDEPFLWGATVFGWVHLIPGEWIWVNQEPRNIHCETWGKWRGAPVNCFARPWKAREGLTLRGDFRIPPNLGVLSECLTMYTEAFTHKPYWKVHENITSMVGGGNYDYFEKCDWPG
jgi:sugar lactone lactonase YvrE